MCTVGWDTTVVAKVLVIWIFSAVIGAVLFPWLIVDVLRWGYASLIATMCLVSSGGALMAGLVETDTSVSCFQYENIREDLSKSA